MNFSSSSGNINHHLLLGTTTTTSSSLPNVGSLNSSSLNNNIGMTTLNSTSTTSNGSFSQLPSNVLSSSSSSQIISSYLSPSTHNMPIISRRQHNLYTNKKKATTMNQHIHVPHIEIYLKQGLHIYERAIQSNTSTIAFSSSQQQQQQQLSPCNTYVVFICSIACSKLNEFDASNYNSSGSNNVRGYNRRILKSNANRSINPIWNELFIFDIHVNNDQQQQQKYIIHENIIMQVWAKHTFKTDELLGVKNINLQNLLRNRENPLSLHLTGNNHYNCQIDLSIIIHDSNDAQLNVNQIGNEDFNTTSNTTSNTSINSPSLHSPSTTSSLNGSGMVGGNNNVFNVFDVFNEQTSLILPNDTLIQNGRYKIIQYISNQASKSGESMLYKIMDLRLNKMKILKKIKCETILNANDAIKESWPLLELQFDHLISYEDMFIDITTNEMLGSIFFVCYVTPFYDEGSLYDFMCKVKKKNIHLTLRRISDYALQIAKGIQFLHDHSIMHRNLKPNNIYFGLSNITNNSNNMNNMNNNSMNNMNNSMNNINVNNNSGGGGSGGEKVLKIGDFGFAKAINNTLSIIGGITKIVNFGYTAPEIALVNEVSVYGFEVDIWSFGIILYELLTLKIDKDQLNHAYLASYNHDNYMKNVIEAEIRKIYKNDAAEEFIQLLRRILVIDPKSRIIASDLIQELTRIKDVYSKQQ